MSKTKNNKTQMLPDIKNLLLLITLFWIGCATTQPSCPTCPSPVVVHDSTKIYVHDTTTIVKRAAPIIQQIAAGIISSAVDTNSVYLTPSGGDDQPAVQALVYAHKHVRLGAGLFHFYRPVLVYTWLGTDYGQSWCWISGVAPAQDINGNYATTIELMDGLQAAFLVQQGKNCIFENLQAWGQYKKASLLSQYQIYTFSRIQWEDGVTSDAATHPHAFVVFDPWCNPDDLGNDSTKGYPGQWSFYVPGMLKNGSTACIVRNCNVQYFNVAYMLTAGSTQNCEHMLFEDDQAGNCISAFVTTQAQAKTIHIVRPQIWGGIHTMFDGVHYGLNHSDGSGSFNVQGLNAAGFNYQLLDIYSNFESQFRDGFCENIEKIGSTGVQTSFGGKVLFDGWEFNFAPGSPVPDSWFTGAGVSWKACTFLYYDGASTKQQRIVLNDQFSTISDCNFGSAPVLSFYQAGFPGPVIQNTILAYTPNPFHSWVNSNSYDSLVPIQFPVLLRSNGQTGYFTTADTSGMTSGVLLLTQHLEIPDPLNIYRPNGGAMNFQFPVGYVSIISGDTVNIQNISPFLPDSTTIYIYKALYRHQ